MDKKQIDELIPVAFVQLQNQKIADKEGRIKKSFRGQISAFGAAISTGSILSGIAFFSQQGSAEVKRDKLIDAVFAMTKEKKNVDDDNLFNYVCRMIKTGKEREVKNWIVDCAIALKLAMNLYNLVD